MPFRPTCSLPTSPSAKLPVDSKNLTDYDRANAAVYLRLLDASVAGVDWRKAAGTILGLDASVDDATARHIYDANLARAQWMTEHGYKQYLTGDDAR